MRPWLLTATLLTFAAPCAAQTPPSPPTAAELRDRADARLRVLDVAEAADALEALGTHHPAEDDATDALRHAIALRLALGQHEAAANAARTFDRYHRRNAPDDADRLVLLVARTLSDAGAHGLAQSLVTRRVWRDLVDRVIARGVEGRASLATGKEQEAQGLFDDVLRLTDDARAMRALSHGIGEDRASARRLGAALSVVGQARHRRARAQREAVALDRVPRYRGPRDRRGLERFFRQEAGPWLIETRAAMEATEAAYLTVLRIEPAPPPVWIIASSADVTAMWSELVDAIEALPDPLLDPELLDGYRAAMDSLTTPIRLRAKQAARICIEYGRKYRVASDDTRRCERWLVTHFPDEHVPTITLGVSASHRAVPNPPRALRRGETD